MENPVVSQDLHYSSSFHSGIVVVAFALVASAATNINPADNSLPPFLSPPLNFTPEIRYGTEHGADVLAREYRPKTVLGKRLMALRHAYIAKGGMLLNDAALDAELFARRGGQNA